MTTPTMRLPFSTYADYGLLFLRLFLGPIMIYGHGYTKLIELTSSNEVTFNDLFGLGADNSLFIAVMIELFCSVLLMIGFYTRFALVPLLIIALLVAFTVHGDEPFATQEKAFLHATSYIALLFTGPGKFSIDAYLSRHNTYSLAQP